MAETSMISANRHRLRAMAKAGNTGAALAEKLLKRIDSLLSVLLISNNLINTVLSILVTGIALHFFGDTGYVLSIATLVAAFLIIVFFILIEMIAVNGIFFVKYLYWRH